MPLFRLRALHFCQQYTGDNCLWTANPGSQVGIQLVLDNGSNNLCGDGSPRQVTQAFVCPATGSSGPLVPKSWTAVDLPGSCEYTVTFETCAACAGGCAPPPPPPPPPPPKCCQAQPAFPGYKDLCMNVTDKTTCVCSVFGFGKTCEWTCGECDAIKGDGQYQKFCLEHKNIKSCSGVNSTCHWVPAY